MSLIYKTKVLFASFKHEYVLIQSLGKDLWNIGLDEFLVVSIFANFLKH